VPDRNGTWRLLIDPPAPGAWNMAVDDALLDGVAAGSSPATLRFFQWDPACLSLGYFQPSGVVDRAACAAAGVDVVRRPTGGRAIYHRDELTYSAVLPLASLGDHTSVLASYGLLSQGLLQGLQALGVPATMAAAKAGGSAAHGPACFDEPSDHELLLDGGKVAGSAQVRRRRAVLQHGSLLFSPQVDALLACLRLTAQEAQRWRDRMSLGVAGLRAHGIAEPMAVASAIAGAFSRVFGVTLAPGTLSQRESQAARELCERKYRSRAWTERI